MRSVPPLVCASVLVLLAGRAVAQLGEVPTLPVGPEQRVGGVFSDRAAVPVYSASYNECPSTSFAIGNGSSYVLEDVVFDPGPFGSTYAGPRDIAEFSGMFQTAGWTSTPLDPATSTPQCRITQVLEFWDVGSFTSAPMLGTTTPFATRSIPTNFGSGFAWPYRALLNPVVSAGTRSSLWLSIRAIDPSTGARIADGNTSLQQPAGETGVNYSVWLGRVGDACVGHSEPDFGRDQNPTSPFGGTFNGGTSFIVGNSPGNVNDRRRTAADFAAGARTLTMGLWADLIIDPPPPLPICPVPDGPTVRTYTPIEPVQWVQLCLPVAVHDATLRYMSIDTEGSTQPMALGFYAGDGSLLAFDDGSGSGAQSQLTFGVGRSAGVDDGAPYDGRDGQLDAGTYYMAIAAPGSTFASAFVVNAQPHSGQQVTFTISTNASGGGNLPTLAPPALNHADLTSGPAWTFPTVDALQASTGPGVPSPFGDASSGVLWSRFTIPAPGASNTGLDTTYLDIDAGASAAGDNVLLIFNTAGDLVAFSDDQAPGTNFLPLLSFGATNPLRSVATGQSRAAANTPTAAWLGQNGDLPPGTYYAASVAWPTDVLTGQGGGTPVLGPNRRFHVRGLSTNNSPHELRFYTGLGFNCDSVDFNGDGLFPDTADIDDFLSVFSGGSCSTGTCGDIDYNNDGLFPDTLDIDALLSVFSGGPCVR
ncbi:MAG TPA: hypothetical protein VHN77_11770 [Phycisphaerales bacterium]|nr:hypothetical protein [Phycisphaerales bacterium]